MHYSEFAQRIKQKYPGAYDSLDDRDLAQRVIDKYPQYATAVDMSGPSMAESAVRGAAQGLTLGHADELTGALESLMTDKSYEQARDESRANYEAAHEAHPVVSTISEMGGSTPAYLLGAAGGLPGMAAVGALQGEGKSDAPIISKETAINAGLGAGLNMALHGAGKWVSGKLASLAPKAEEQAVRAIGGTANEIRNLGEAKSHELGRTILNKKLLNVAPGELPDQIAAMKAEIAPIYEKFLGSVPEEKWLKPQQIVDDLEALKTQLTKGGTGGYDADKIALVDKAIATIEGKPAKAVSLPGESFEELGLPPKVELPELPNRPGTALAPETVKGIKTDLQDVAKWQQGENTLRGNTNRAIAGTVRRTFEKSLDDVPGTEAYKAANKAWGQTEVLEDMAMRTAAKSFGAPIVTGTDAAFGALGMLTGSPVRAIESMGIRRAIRFVFSPKNIARTYDALSKNAGLAEPIFGKFAPIIVNAARRGPQALAVTHYTMQQRDPAYREMFGGEEQ